jgi:signal transduction histidine kinase
MNIFQNQILTVLTAPPGNLVYHLVIAFSIAGALFGAVNLWRNSQFPQARRAIIGLGVLLGLQILMFALSSLAWQGFVIPENLLPPLDRAVTLISLTWITWLWAFPEPVRAADAATLLLNLLAVAFCGLTLAAWSQGDTTAFLDHASLDLIWQILSLAFVVFGIVTLAVRQPNGWNYGMGMLAIAFAGHVVEVIVPTTGDFSGTVRLAQMAMYPILLTLSQRFPLADGNSGIVAVKRVRTEKVTKLEKSSATGQQAAGDKRRYSTDPKTFHALLTLAAETDPDKIGNALTRSVAQATLADLCFLVTPDGDKNLTIAYGYDLIREEAISGVSLANETAPMLANAVQRGRPLRLPSSGTSSDLKGLGQALGLTSAGHLLSIPVVSPEKGALGSILLLSPYSNRLWNAEDQAFLNNVSTLFIPILERARTMAIMKHERDVARQDAQASKETANIAQRKASEAIEQFESVREKSSQLQMQAENMAALVAMQEESQKLIEQLKGENTRLRQSSDYGGTSAFQAEQAEKELRLALTETAHLQNALAEANIKILELEKHQTASISSEQAEVVASISQELRQPMSSIVGYTDLLLGESVGILGALQRKFIERIKASTERIGGLVDDLIQVTTMETNPVEIKYEAVDLNLIIDNAVAYTSTQIREKNITLQLDTSGIPPQVNTDREALQQILIHLLQNAGSASPTDGTIGLHIHIQKQENKDYLQIEVSDTGGGIASEDLEHVFQRRYRADHPLIQGLGDTSVGLSIAKALVDAQKGRIWVDSKPSIGSTFSVLLPIVRNITEEK